MRHTQSYELNEVSGTLNPDPGPLPPRHRLPLMMTVVKLSEWTLEVTLTLSCLLPILRRANSPSSHGTQETVCKFSPASTTFLQHLPRGKSLENFVGDTAGRNPPPLVSSSSSSLGPNCRPSCLCSPANSHRAVMEA